MFVKIETEGMFGDGRERKRYGAGSVVEVAEDVYQLNKSWMEPTDAKPHRVTPAEEKEPAKDKKDK